MDLTDDGIKKLADEITKGEDAEKWEDVHAKLREMRDQIQANGVRMVNEAREEGADEIRDLKDSMVQIEDDPSLAGLSRYERKEVLEGRETSRRYTRWGIMSVALIFSTIGSCMWGMPQWGVYKRRLEGQGVLAESKASRLVKLEEAKAAFESAKELAKAEEERAKGVAKANAIIGDSLQDNEQYLRYLWIQGLHDGSSEVIYIPTEANMPILEAARKMPKTIKVVKEE